MLAFSTGLTHAQTNQSVQNFRVNLTGVDESGAPVKISNKQILEALGGSNSTFSVRARLVAITPDNGTLGIFVRDPAGGTNTDTDVSGSFGNVIGTTVERPGHGAATEISIQTFTFNSDTLSYNVQGYTTGNVHNDTLHSTVTGAANDGGSAAVVMGSVTLGPSKTESIP